MGFKVMTPELVKVVTGFLSRFCLAFTVAPVIKALRHLSSVALLISTALTWRIVAQQNWIGRRLAVCPVGFRMALPTGMFKTKLKWLFRHGRDTQAGQLGRID